MKIVRVLIWLGFVALLAVSIPKTAWVFRSWEESAPVLITAWGESFDILWAVPLFVAFCIDALILALTYTMSVDKTKLGQGFMWFFVSGLAIFSYYCNLLYNFAHNPTGSIWTAPFVGGVTPFIISGIPLFALCYTLILSRINGTVETLEEKAARLEDEKEVKARIREVRKGRFLHVLTDGAKEVIAAAKEISKEVHPGTDSGIVQAPEPEAPEEPQPEVPIEPKGEQEGSDTVTVVALNDVAITTLDRFPDITSLISTSRRTATVKEVAKATGYTEKWIKDRRDKKVIRASSRNSNLIVLESVISWLNSLPGEKQKESDNTAKMPVLTVEKVPATNGTNHD